MKFLQNLMICLSVTTFAIASPSALADAKEAWRAYLANDYERAVELAKDVAESGDKDAQYLMGLANKHGRGIAKNEEAAMRWFSRSAERGHADALNDLATCYSRGEGVARDDTKAFEYFRLAAERGSTAGQRNVGQMYEQGVGTQKDSLKALYWYERVDASIYARELRRKLKAPPSTESVPKQKLSDRCKPAAPPTYAMNRAKVDRVTGYVDFYVDERGKARGVTATELNNDEFRYHVVAVFSKSLRAEDCSFDDGVSSMRIPFTFVLK
jgi:TPR repeat protein